MLDVLGSNRLEEVMQLPLFFPWKVEATCSAWRGPVHTSPPGSEHRRAERKADPSRS